jgi:hypothetical protein
MAFEFPDRAGIDEITYFGIVTGTHSAGKSTLVNSLSDPVFTERFRLDHSRIHPNFPKLGGRVLDISGMQVPLIVIEEASTFYVRKTGDPTVVTDNYTFEDQILMEELTCELRGLAAEHMSEILPELQPAANPRIGVLLSDRFTPDGFAYSSLRTPDKEQDLICLQDLYMKKFGEPGNTVPGLKTPVRTWDHAFVRNYCDFVLIPDHSEVAFEDNGLRQTDLAFRETVATAINRVYTEIIGAEKIHSIKGTPQEATAAALAIIVKTVMNGPVAA